MTTDPSPESPSGFPRWLAWSLFGALAVLVLGYGAIFLYAKVINDSPDEFDASDLDAALEIDGSQPDEPAAPDPSATADPSATTDPSATGGTTSSEGAEPAGDEQVWTVTDQSQVGYRVEENLFGVDTEAVGRTNRITGTFVIVDTEVVRGEFEVDVASIESDDSRRDRQFRERIMSTDEFPDATFTLTGPIDLGADPAAASEVVTTATGDLTLRGVTNTVTFDVTAERQGERVGVLGAIPVVFADYSIANPSFGGITTDDEGLLEFVLVFEPA